LEQDAQTISGVDGYGLEGFDVPNVTIEVASSQIVLKEGT